MTNSFFPKSDAALVVWATNYKQKISASASVLNLTAEQVAAEISYCDDLIDAVNAVKNQKQAFKSAVDAKKTIIETKGGALRAEIARHKTAVGYSDAIGQDLSIVSVNLGFDTNAYKPKLNTELFGGYVRIKYRKNGVDGVNIYHRKKGSAAWLFLARTTKSPFDNHIVLETAGQPEHCEYRAFGVIDDSEIGQASDIVEVVYGG
jgi:hypothetical protein